MSSDTESEKLVAKSKESVTTLYESRFRVGTAVGVFWAVCGLLCAAAAVGFQVGLRRYLGHARLAGLSPERSVIWFWWGFTVLFILVFALVPLGLYLSRIQRYIIHSEGVRLATGKKTSMDLPFSSFRSVQLGRWWQAFATFASGFSGSHATGLLILLNKKAPLSFMFGGGTRQMWIEPENPQAFLEELNRAWDGWRLKHGEGPAGGGTTSPQGRAG